MRDAGIGAAHPLGNVRVQLGQTLDVCLVDDGVGVFVVRRAVVAPVEERVDHHRLRHARRGVVVVAAVGVAEVVAEQRLVPLEVAVDGFRVRVDQQLVRVAPVPGGRVVGPVHPVAVALTGFDGRQKAVPDEAVHLVQRHPGLGAVGVEEAQLHLLGDLAEYREVGARAVVGRAQRVGLAGPLLDRRPPAASRPNRQFPSQRPLSPECRVLTARPTLWGTRRAAGHTFVNRGTMNLTQVMEICSRETLAEARYARSRTGVGVGLPAPAAAGGVHRLDHGRSGRWRGLTR